MEEMVVSWQKLLGEYFPGSDMQLIFGVYGPRQHDRHDILVREVKEAIEASPLPVVIVGTSFGGLLVHSAIGQLEPEWQSKVKAIVGYAVPYHMAGLMLSQKNYRLLKVGMRHPVPHVAGAGLFDLIVPFWLAQHKHSVNMYLPAGHFALRKKTHARRVLRKLKQLIAS